MRRVVMIQVFVVLGLAVSLVGCYTGPVVSKSAMGNLEINVYAAEPEVDQAELYLDDLFIGNATRDMPVLHVKRGAHVIRVELPGYEAYERTITILGDPNHQALNVHLKKE